MDGWGYNFVSSLIKLIKLKARKERASRCAGKPLTGWSRAWMRRVLQKSRRTLA